MDFWEYFDSKIAFARHCLLLVDTEPKTLCEQNTLIMSERYIVLRTLVMAEIHMVDGEVMRHPQEYGIKKVSPGDVFHIKPDGSYVIRRAK